MSDAAVELSCVAVSFVLYIAYHLWFFVISGSGLRQVQASAVHKNLFDRGKIARVQFAEMICESNDTICGIQQERNCLVAVSFLAGTVSLLARKILSILLDDTQIEQIRKYGVRCSRVMSYLHRCAAQLQTAPPAAA
jgi:membrane glycosyltransferase